MTIVQGTIKSVDEYLRQKVASAPKGGKKTAQAQSATPLKSPKNTPKEATQAEFEATSPPKHSATVSRNAGQAESQATSPLEYPKNDAKEAKRTEFAEITETINRIRNEFACYRDPSYQEAFPDLTNVQFQYLQGIVNGLRSDLTSLLNLIKGMKKFETL